MRARNFAIAMGGGMAMLTMTAATITQAQETPAPGGAWQFEFTPYIFGSALSGTTGVGRVTADVDMSFGDILNNLDSGFMALFEARKGLWSFGIDGVYFKLENEKTGSWQGPGGIGSITGDLEATMTEQVYQPAVSYRLRADSILLDVIGAARYTQLDSALDLTFTTGPLLPGGSRSLSAGESWWDPVIGMRIIAPVAQHWSLVGYADIGGFGIGSDTTYQLIAGANWQFADSFSAKAGYRYFYQDFEDDGFVWDMAADGAYLGLGIQF